MHVDNIAERRDCQATSHCYILTYSVVWLRTATIYSSEAAISRPSLRLSSVGSQPWPPVRRIRCFRSLPCRRRRSVRSSRFPSCRLAPVGGRRDRWPHSSAIESEFPRRRPKRRPLSIRIPGAFAFGDRIEVVESLAERLPHVGLEFLDRQRLALIELRQRTDVALGNQFAAIDQSQHDQLCFVARDVPAAIVNQMECRPPRCAARVDAMRDRCRALL